MKVVKKNTECETLWRVKVVCNENSIVIGGVYSPCEENVSQLFISNFVRELEKDLVEIKEHTTENIILVGDFNAHIGNDKEGVSGNHEKIGRNGKEYRRFIKERELRLMNNSVKAIGKWTRVEGEQKSILDFTLATHEMEEKIVKLTIDEEHKYALESKRCKTDHNVSVVEIDANVKREKDVKRETINCNNNWERFTEVLQFELSTYSEKCTYENMENAIKKAGKEVMTKRYKKQKKKILGYNDEIKVAIKERRARCTAWKKETDQLN